MALLSFENLQHSYKQLGEQFYSMQAPTPVTAPMLIRLNRELAEQLNLDPAALASEEGLKLLAGNAIPDNIEPIATVYAGHQFGGWNPQLGDGRAILLGEVLAQDGRRYDIQLKGAGRTPYSRMGDGRSPIGPVIREYLVSEAMAAFGVPTTRALAAVATGEPVMREGLLPGGILTRVAQSHLRVGTMQYFSARGDLESVKALADYVIERHYAEQIEQSREEPYTALLTSIVAAQAQLIAQWMSLGFIHGVMNTDNMLLCGETVDYGPCAFMDSYNPMKVFSSIDTQGRYAFANQAEIGRWNLSWLAQALLPLMAEAEGADEQSALKKAEAILENYSNIFMGHYQHLLAEKLGFAEASEEVNPLSLKLLQLMAEEGADFSLTFRTLADHLAPPGERQFLNDIHTLPDTFANWIEAWQGLLGSKNIAPQEARRLMNRKNPAYIPRNHQVEAAIQGAMQGDYSHFNRMADVFARPYEYSETNHEFTLPPTPEEEVQRTFCGT